MMAPYFAPIINSRLYYYYYFFFFLKFSAFVVVNLATASVALLCLLTSAELK